MSVVEKEREPREVTRTIVDITTKEFINRGKDVVDKTKMQLQKTTATPGGEKYRFTTPRGVNFGFGGNIGPQVMALSISGGSLRITGQFSGTSRLQNEHAYSLSYNREEKISVPPTAHFHSPNTMPTDLARVSTLSSVNCKSLLDASNILRSSMNSTLLGPRQEVLLLLFYDYRSCVHFRQFSLHRDIHPSPSL